MKYCSTRGQEAGLTFKQVLFAGYAKDLGLYMPEDVPVLGPEELQHLKGCSFPELVCEIARKFIDEAEIPTSDLEEVIKDSLKRFRIPEVVRVEKLKGGLNIVELFHGTTLAFKDLGLSVVCGLLSYFLAKSSRHVTVLVGTSGDTGSAAIEGVRGRANMDIVVLLPKGRCTAIQELQMTTVLEDNVHVYRVDGSSDDLDHPIKQCFADTQLVAKHNLISVNSINWGRILVQVAHFFYTYFQLCEEVGCPVEVVIPTGACGNITAGCIAQKMGLPITLVAGVNTNNIVARTLGEGDFSVKGDVVTSLAPAMDIQVPYNVERMMYLYANKDTARVRQLMQEFEKSGKVIIPEDIMKAMKTGCTGTFTVDDDEITKTLRRVHQEHHYVLCPHTAVAAAYHYSATRKIGEKSPPKGYIATASPAKFPEALQRAGLEPVTDLVAHLHSLPTRSVEMKKGEDWYSMLKAKIESISAGRAKA